jgi:ketosteroid isomerase-like protein
MTTDAPTNRKQLVARLFDAWSSRDPDRLEPLFHPRAKFSDTVNGQFAGWPAIRAFYQRSLESWARIDTRATRIWVDGDTAACTWIMEGEICTDRFGPELVGTTCRIDGMAWIQFDGDLIVHDEEYFDRGSLTATAPSV